MNNARGFTVDACLVWRVMGNNTGFMTIRDIAEKAMLGREHAKTAVWSLLNRGMLEQHVGVNPYRYRANHGCSPELIAKIERASRVWCDSPVADRRGEVLAILGE